MGTGAITQYIDVAQVVFYIFLLFFVGLYLLVGFYDSIVFFGKKIKGTIGFICGLVFIVIGVKFIGVLFQAYGVYEFFK